MATITQLLEKRKTNSSFCYGFSHDCKYLQVYDLAYAKYYNKPQAETIAEAARRAVWGELVSMFKGRAVWTPQAAAVADYLCDNAARGLIMTGGCGTGKTALLNVVLSAWRKAHGLVIPLLTELTPQDAARSIIAVDDVGKNKVSGWADDEFCRAVDAVANRGGLLLMTTNLTGAGLCQLYGRRTIDRIAEMCRPIKFDGVDFRAVKAAQSR